MSIRSLSLGRWFRHLPTLAGIAAFGLGATVLFGWATGRVALVQVRPDLPPMQVNTALSFAAAGLALLLVRHRWRRLGLVLGVGVASLAVLVFSQYVTGLDLGIDQFLLAPWTTAWSPYPGRMAPSTAVGFAVIGLAIILAGMGRHGFAVSLAGALAFTLGGIALVVQLNEGPSGFMGSANRMAVSTAAGFALLGAGMMSLGYRGMRSQTNWRGHLVAASAAVLAAFLLWQSLLVQEDEQLRRLVSNTMGRIVAEIELTISQSAGTLGVLARGFATSDEEIFDRVSSELVAAEAIAGLRRVERLERPLPAQPPAAAAPLADPDRRATLVEELLDHVDRAGGPAIAGPFGEGDEDGVIRLVVPAPEPRQRRIYVSAVIDVDPFFGAVVSTLGPGFEVRVSNGARAVFRTSSPGEVEPLQRSAAMAIPGPDGWSVTVAPLESVRAEYSSHLPQVVFGASLVLAFLLGLIAQFGSEQARRVERYDRMVRRRTQALEETMARLHETKQQLEEEARAKDRFLRVLGHELRNPLGAIQSALAVIRAEFDPAIADRLPLDVVERQTQQLRGIVGDLLDISLIERGKLRVERQPLDLAALVREAAEARRVDAERGNIALALDTPADPVWVEGDETRLVQVIDNLLTNALKHSADGGHVEVAVDLDDDGSGALLSVKDDGEGIAPELLETIFDPFVQTTENQNDGQGLGLGLSIVKGLVERHDGNVEAHSDGVDRGAEFVCRFPAISSSDVQETGAEDDVERARSRILLVDDHEDGARMLASLLDKAGFEVRLAHDGATALRLAEDQPPDAVICDLNLPDMDGFEVARKMRARPEMETTPIFAVTGYGDERALEETQNAGFDAHFLKPVDIQELKAALTP